MSSSAVPAHLPKHGEIKALIAFARNKGANGHDDQGKAEQMLQKMKDRGVDLKKVQRATNKELFDDRGSQEFILERISYVQTGEESPYSKQRRESRSASVAKGRRTKKRGHRSSRKRSHKSSRKRGHSRRR